MNVISQAQQLACTWISISGLAYGRLQKMLVLSDPCCISCMLLTALKQCYDRTSSQPYVISAPRRDLIFSWSWKASIVPLTRGVSDHCWSQGPWFVEQTSFGMLQYRKAELAFRSQKGVEMSSNKTHLETSCELGWCYIRMGSRSFRGSWPCHFSAWKSRC